MTGATFSVVIRFSPALLFFLPKRERTGIVTRTLREKTSIKDVIEACGVPHPEVHFIRCNGESVGFDHQLESDTEIEVFALRDHPGEGLQKRCVSSFVADGHLGKLARDLRLLGFDVSYSPHAEDQLLVALTTAKNRALLTRDRRLLMHKVIQHGYCPRSDNPDEQIIEVIQRFELEQLIAPFTRCIRCNGLLQQAEKADLLPQLEPLTKIYYEEFRRCGACGAIYWAGSHFEKLKTRIAKVRAAVLRSRP